MRHRVKERVAGRAYDLYQERGNRDGDDMRHWLQAESEILSSVPEIRESGSWYTINVPLRGFTAGEVHVNVEPQYALIAAEKEKASADELGRASDVFAQPVFSNAKWPTNVEPSTASAYLKNGVLTLTVKKATAGTGGPESRSA